MYNRNSKKTIDRYFKYIPKAWKLSLRFRWYYSLSEALWMGIELETSLNSYFFSLNIYLKKEKEKDKDK